MPLPAQWFGLVLPLTYYLNILRGILLKGVGLAQLWRPTVALSVFAMLILLIAVKRFSKTIE
jgi:ABC-2 type transport system permease protein